MHKINLALAANQLVTKPPLVVEVMGPAGAGKTTILRALSCCHKGIQPDFHPSKITQFPFFIGNTLALLPTHLLQYRYSRWFNRREIRSMAYLKAGLHEIRRQTSNNDAAIILDHGPIYRLAYLRALGPQITSSPKYKKWWISLFNKWTDILDIVIWLDAPNAVLLERIHSRNRWHAIKEKCEQEAHDFLNHYRTFLEQTITEPVTNQRITLVRFDTNQESVEQIVDKILATFNAAKNL